MDSSVYWMTMAAFLEELLWASWSSWRSAGGRDAQVEEPAGPAWLLQKYDFNTPEESSSSLHQSMLLWHLLRQV